MKKIKIKVVLQLFATFLVFACSDDFPKENLNLNFDQEVYVNFDEEVFVSLEQVTNVADMFLNKEIDKKGNTKLLSKASIEIVMDESNPAMYIVNYPEGGWVIVSATRNYYPVLAYSEEGSFELKPEAEMGGSFLWLEETKEAVRVSSVLDDSIKTYMRYMWEVYERKEIKPSNGAKNWSDFYARINQLYTLYSANGWTFTSLSDASGYINYYEHQNLLNMANSFNSPPEYTIVGIKNPQWGQLLTTQWHQSPPFNNDVEALLKKDYPNDDWPAGCGPVAMAQIMKYYNYPNYTTTPPNFPSVHISKFSTSPGWSTVFSWSNMTNTGGSSTPYLVHAVGRAAGAVYYAAPVGAGTTIDNVKYAFESIFGYTSATKAAHSSATVTTNIKANKPVYMTGGSHAWVCDGVKETKYMVELLIGSNYDDLGYYTVSNPGNSQYVYYHMNWCLGSYQQGWFLQDYVNPTGYDFSSNRQNLYITK